jgi:hypothetical protein
LGCGYAPFLPLKQYKKLEDSQLTTARLIMPGGSVNIFGKKVTFHYFKNAELDQLDGFFDPVEFKIHINKKSPDKMPIYLHEIIHCVLHRVGLNQTSLTSDLQEIIAENISCFLVENLDEINKAKKKFDEAKKKELKTRRSKL